MKKQNKRVRFWLRYHIGLLVFSSVASLFMKYQQTGKALHPTVIVAFSTMFLMTIGIGYLAIFMVNRAKLYNQTQINKKILPALLIFYIMAYLIANFSVTIGVLGWFIYLGRDLSDFWSHLLKYELNFASGRFFLWLMFFSIAFFYILWQKSTKKEQKLREENLKFKYRNLKSQVNPHFLFNSLNTLSEIIYEDTRKADDYIQKLSRIYRYIIENEETDLIALNEELEFVKHYFDLQKERDTDKIQLEISFQNTDQLKVVPVSVQILVENALKHNSRSEKSPLRIRIDRSDEDIVVSNNIQRKNTLENTSKTGLLNLKERVKLILDRDLVLQEENNQFIVKLPFIQI